jgi:hypothetical protein
MPECLGDLLGGAHLELGVESATLSGISEHPTGTMAGVGATGADAEQRQSCIAFRSCAVTHRTLPPIEDAESQTWCIPADHDSSSGHGREDRRSSDQSRSIHNSTLRAAQWRGRSRGRIAGS